MGRQHGKGPKQGRKSGQSFWDKEYKNAGHLQLSDEPSEDLMKFTRFLERESGKAQLNLKESVVDLGCGNGRNLIWLAKTYGMRGTGYDISHSAIAQAKKASVDLPLSYEARSIAGSFPFEDESQTFVLDMMVSHFLRNDERLHLTNEIARILKPGGWLFFKTFLREDDKHAKRLLEDHPADEEGSYIHPEIGVAEHVFTEHEIIDLLSPHFTIHKIHKSHGHLRRNAKRRSIVVYAEKSY